MSIDQGEEIFGVGMRLREERVRLDWSQEALGTRIGTTGRTIKKYEGNETSPRAVELFQLFSLGFDIHYIVTGQRMPIGVAQSRAPYTAAERAAVDVASLQLTEENADLVRTIAFKLSKLPE